jgi:hypothetical protein
VWWDHQRFPFTDGVSFPINSLALPTTHMWGGVGAMCCLSLSLCDYYTAVHVYYTKSVFHRLPRSIGPCTMFIRLFYSVEPSALSTLCKVYSNFQRPTGVE